MGASPKPCVPMPRGIEQSTVFPGQVEVMEGAKRIIPSRIWPQVFDDVLIDLGKPLYLFEDLALGIEKAGLGFPDGKIGTFGFLPAVACGQSTGQNVEATPDAVDDSPHFRVDHRVEGFDIRQAVEFLAGVRIGINSHGIGMALLPFDDPLYQRWELGYGPIDSGLSIQ